MDSRPRRRRGSRTFSHASMVSWYWREGELAISHEMRWSADAGGGVAGRGDGGGAGVFGGEGGGRGEAWGVGGFVLVAEGFVEVAEGLVVGEEDVDLAAEANCGAGAGEETRQGRR